MMMMVLATACVAFGPAVSEAKTEIICLQAKDGGRVSLTANAASHNSNKRSMLGTLGQGYERRQRAHHREAPASTEGLVPLPAVQHGDS